MNRIFQTDASIVNDVMGNDFGKITKLAGAIDHSAINLYLTLESFRKLPLDFIPKAKLEFEVTPFINIVKITTNKELSPLKKGDMITFLFEDETYFQRRFEAGRILSGKEVINIISFTNLQLWALTQCRVTRIKIISALEMIYDFVDTPNEQYENEAEGQKLLQIVCNNLVGIKRILLKMPDVSHNSENDANYLLGLNE